jgi:chromosome segregation ATPase
VEPSKSKRAPSAPPLHPNIDRERSSIDEVYNEVNKLKGEIKELKTDLNEIVKDQDMLKIIQLEHEAKISELNKLGNTLETNQTSHVKNFKNIQNKHEEFDNALQTLNTNMKKFQETINAADNEIIKFKDKITMQRQELKQLINDNINPLQNQITKLEKEFKEITDKEINKIQKETAVLMKRVGNLEETINTLRLPPTMKKAFLPYVERLAPVDLIEVDWKEHRQENEGNINN